MKAVLVAAGLVYSWSRGWAPGPRVPPAPARLSAHVALKNRQVSSHHPLTSESYSHCCFPLAPFHCTALVNPSKRVHLLDISVHVCALSNHCQSTPHLFPPTPSHVVYVASPFWSFVPTVIHT